MERHNWICSGCKLHPYSVISQYPCVGAWSFISFYLSHTSYLCNTKKKSPLIVLSNRPCELGWLGWPSRGATSSACIRMNSIIMKRHSCLFLTVNTGKNGRYICILLISYSMPLSCIVNWIKGAKLSHCSLGLNIVFHSATGCCMRFWMSQMSLENICIITGHMNTWLVLITYRLIIVKDLNWTKAKK